MASGKVAQFMESHLVAWVSLTQSVYYEHKNERLV